MNKFLIIFVSGIIGYIVFQKRSSIMKNQVLRNILIAVLMELPIFKTVQDQT
ncbi:MULTISPECIES: hypothetical protein [Bacillaceae]|uniref:hypothetical protein n=1 Tax=Bacillaceae TaxID=186817 RepID=UPI001585A9EE|nr:MULTISPECIES: hypothetical protein [Bacillaceae]